MSHLETEARQRGWRGRDADRYGHTISEGTFAPGFTQQGPPESEATAPPPGTVPALNPDDFYVKWDATNLTYVPARKGETGAVFDDTAWADANAAREDVATGGGTGPSGPTAAELAIERSKVQATNLSTFIQGTVSELQLEIDADRLDTEQALGEFNRRLDAFAEAGKQFQGLLPFTIPRGAEFAPGFGPGEIGEQLGIEPVKANPINIDPFQMAQDIVNQTPDLTGIGVPSG
ncbi:hypothetical protein LCGC14_2756650, partial [marine sediment metagenome]